MKILPMLIITMILTGAVTLQPVMAADQAQPATGNPDSGKTVRQKAAETVDAIKSYSVEKKDEAVKKAKEALDDFDAREDRLEQRIKEKKSEWSAKIAKKKEEELAELKKMREEVVARYEKLKAASKQTWETTKHAFIRSYYRLIHKLDKVNSDTLASNEESHGDVSQNPSASR